MLAMLLLTAAVSAQPPTGADRPGQPPGAATSPADRSSPAGAASLDGQWTVISLERNGQPVPNAQNMTVTVRGNTVTFDAGKATGGAAGNANQMRAMRLDFGRDGRVFVTEANADGKFDATGTGSGGRSGAGGTGGTTGAGSGTGTDRPGGTAGVDRPSTRDERRDATGAGSTTGASGTGGTGAGAPRAGEPAIPAGSKSGVYVLTQDYFAVCIHEENRPGTSPGGSGGTGLGDYRPTPGGSGAGGTGGTGGTTGSGTTGSGTTGSAGGERTGTGPGGTGATPPAGGTGSGTGGTGAGSAAGGLGSDRAGMAGGMTPQNRSYVTVILKRGGGAGGAGAAPDRR